MPASADDPAFEESIQSLDDMHDLYQAAVDELGTTKPAWFRQAESDARNFMGSLTLDVGHVEVVLLKEGEPLRDIGMHEPPTTIAQASDYEPLIFVRRAKAARLLRRYGQGMIGSMLVHEFTHGTAPPGTQVYRKGSDGETQMDFRLGLAQQHGGRVLGLFFEEGLAEFMAGWYRRTQVGIAPTISIASRPSEQLPEHFDYGDMRAVSGPDGYAVELMAWGMQRHRILHQAADLVSIMLETHHPETQTGALREFARAVESLEPGLYDHLRHLEYSAESWHNACRDIYHIVTRARRGQLRSIG